MQYTYNGTIKCKKEEAETVKSFLNLFVFERSEVEGLNGETFVIVSDETRGDITREIEKFCETLKAQKIFVNGTISYFGDYDGKYTIENSEYKEFSAAESTIMDAHDQELIRELNNRGYSVYKVPTGSTEEPEDGQETFCVSMKVDGRVYVYVNAPKGDFEAAKKAAEIEFSSSGDYDCGVVENIDSFPVNATDSEDNMVDF